MILCHIWPKNGHNHYGMFSYDFLMIFLRSEFTAWSIVVKDGPTDPLRPDCVDVRLQVPRLRNCATPNLHRKIIGKSRIHIADYISHFRFNISNFRFHIAYSIFQISYFTFHISDFRFELSDFRLLSDFRFQIPGVRLKIPDFRLHTYYGNFPYDFRMIFNRWSRALGIHGLINCR